MSEADLARFEAWLASEAMGLALAALFGAVWLAQRFAPAFARAPRPAGRLRTNLSIGAITMASQTLAAAFLASALAFSNAREWGLMARFDLSAPVELGLGVLAVSLIGYWAHRLAHRWDWLWRIHRVHHADTHLDVTSALRHHPFEALLSVAAGGVFAALLGLSALAVVVHGLLVLVLGFFQHADLRTPARLDAALRLVIATPHMHHVHHSCERARTDSNYGDVFSFWDRLFGSYRAPRAHGETRFGLGDKADLRAHELGVQLRSPFGS